MPNTHKANTNIAGRPQRSRFTWPVILLIMAVVAAGFSPAASGEAQSQGDPAGDQPSVAPLNKSGQSNMDSILANVVDAYEAEVGPAAQGAGQASDQAVALAADEAAALAPVSKGGTVLVTAYMIIDANGVAADTAPVVAWLQDNSVEARRVGDGYIEVYAPVRLLEALSKQPGVSRLQAALPPRRAQSSTLVPSDAAKLHEADHWFDAGITGRGVKVGIVDGGFEGIAALQEQGHLPNILLARCYVEDSSDITSNVEDCEYDGVHGTAVAESVADVAPHATLYISNPQSKGDLQDAVEWMEGQGVEVINHSVSWTPDGPGDGTSPQADSPLRTIDSAVEAGAVWVNSAGNDADNVWYGDFETITSGGSEWVNFGTAGSPDVDNNLNLQQGQDSTLIALLRWDDEWANNSSEAGADCDLDLFAYRPGNPFPVGSGSDVQSGSHRHTPTEVLTTEISSGQFGIYQLRIHVYDCDDAPEWIQLTAWTNAPLEFTSSSHHVANPEESANAGMLAVGAAPYSNVFSLSSYSSRGPTAADGRTKPEIVGVDCGTSLTYGTFCGTSQASPHVAGLAALAIDRYGGDEDYDSPEEIADYLKDNAVQRVSTPDPNNLWGHGFATLPNDLVFDVDHDVDDDGLIEVSSVDQLDAIRYDLNGDGQADNDDDETLYRWAFRFAKDGMGCNEDETDTAEQVCVGYELTADLDFDSDNDGDVDEHDHKRLYWDDGQGWDPIGTFQGVLEGNGHTIANLTINRDHSDETMTDPSATAAYYGLFEEIGVLAAVRNLVLDDANVVAGARAGVQNGAGLWNFEHAFVGPLAGENQGQITSVSVTNAEVRGIDDFNAAGGLVGRNAATITSSYATGTVQGETAGGLTGETYSNRSHITNSYAEATVTGINSIGGLVGFAVSTTIEDSYAKGTLTDRDSNEDTPPTVSAGGLVGGGYFITVTNNYATAAIQDADDAGGLIADGAANTVTDSYWDTTTTGQTQSQDSPNTAGKTTSELQAPTGATGIYANWPTGTWDFGTATQYPALKADHNRDGTATWQEFGNQRPTPQSVNSVDPEAAAAGSPLQGPVVVDKSRQSNMDSILANVVDAYEAEVGPAAQGAGQASDQAAALAADEAAALAPVSRGGTVLVTAYMIIDANGVAADTASVVAWLQDNSVEARLVGDGYIEVYAPVGLLEALASQPAVSRLQAALPPRRAQSSNLVPSDAAKLHEADHWFDAGITGRGVKVGIVDVGFEGIKALHEQGHLPNLLVARCYREDSWRITNKVEDCEYDSVHGTAVAESVADVAPHATLYISNPGSKGELQDAVEWMEGQGVQVINHSVGWVPDGPGDGTSPSPDSPLRTIDSAVEAGAVWVNAAGNDAENVWYGDFQLMPSNRFINFGTASSPDSGNRINVQQGQDDVVIALLRWDDEWANNMTEAGADCDLDLLLRRSRDSYHVALGQIQQAGAYFSTPIEVIVYRVPSGEHGNYDLRILVRECDDPPEWIQLTAWTKASLEHASSAHHVANPEESANAGMLAVGAAPSSNVFSLSSYSSRGPTAGDGRIKPEIVGVDCGVTLTYGDDDPFCGTSQASPHVAGLAALAIDRYGGDEDYDSPEEIADYLKDNAVQRVAAPDPNNLWGHGFATLPNDLVFDADHDVDDDGLIEVSSVDQLDAIRYDLNGDGQADNDDDETSYFWAFRFAKDGMGCNEDETDTAEQVCVGYELTADLDFDSDEDGDVDQDDHKRLYYNDGQGWDPIGTFQAVLEGNGHTISSLTINRDHTDETMTDPSATAAYYGLFEEIGVLAEVRNLVLADANVVAGARAGVQNAAGLWNFEHAFVGTLAGENQGQITSVSVTGASVRGIDDFNTAGGLVGRNAATITSSYATGTVQGETAGGLAGEAYSNRSHITGSYAEATVTGINSIGGLVGFAVSTSIEDSYAKGTLTDRDSNEDTPPTVDAGGLVGGAYFITVTNSYATAAIQGADDAGGLIADGAANTVTDSYWDTTTTGQTQSQDSPNTAGKTTAELQAPTTNTGIYANWPTSTWDFGTTTQYPALKADHNRDGTATWQEFGNQRPTPQSANSVEPEAATVALLQGPLTVDKSGQSNMDSILANVVDAYEAEVGPAAQGAGQASDQAKALAADEAAALAPVSRGGTVLVTAYMTVDANGVAADTAPVLAWLQSNSVEARRVGDGYIEVYAPVNLAEALSKQPGVSRLQAALPPRRSQSSTLVPSDAAALHEADHWFDAGITGRGVKVGIVDGGFEGTAALQEQGHLPNILVARCYVEDSSRVTSDVEDCEYGGVHGTAVAESVADVAPHATLYISNPQTKGDLQDAVEWMEGQGVEVINHSVGWVPDGPGDGTSPSPDSPLHTIDSAVEAGAVWVNAAGNDAENVWYGDYEITGDDNMFINFGTDDSPDIFNTLELEQGEDDVLIALLRWEDEWANNSTEAGADCDLDLYAYRPGAVYLIQDAVAYSAEYQTGHHIATPLEVLQYEIPSGEHGTYEVAIYVFDCDDPPEWVQFTAWTSASLEFTSSSHHVGNPEESANAGMLAVGAAPASNVSSLSSYSSRGPTVDGRIKPEIVGVDCGVTLTYGDGDPFCGTSQASPHVAGLAALAIDRYGGDEDYDSPDEIADYLKDNATQRVATPDPNNLWGHGFATLPNDFTFDADHDVDDDGLIEVSSVDQLDAIRYDLNGDGQADNDDDAPSYLWAFRFAKDGMGCNEDETDTAEQVCVGYELTADLDFDSDNDGDVDQDDHKRLYWDDGQGWDPIGTFQGVLEGNGHTIANLTINRDHTNETMTDPSATATYYGLFEEIGVLAEVRNLVLADANVTAGSRAGVQNSAGLWNFEHAFVGTLAGENQGQITSVSVTNASVRGVDSFNTAGGLVGRNAGTITSSYATGTVRGETAGGLAGEAYSNRSHITASYAEVNVYGINSIGGLAGFAVSTTIEDSYAKGTLTDRDSNEDTPPTVDAGGLVGTGYFITVTNSYAANTIEDIDDAGGLIADGAANTVTDSYWDTTTTGQTQSQDSPTTAGKTTSELQAPTTNTGIYQDWSPTTWDFGTTTQYPALKADHDRDGTPTWQEFGNQRPNP